jgi:GT2 family glycosyltransferase
MSSKMPRLATVSIVVVNYNAGMILTECIGLGLEQGGEVIVVDNASSDSSIELLESNYANDPRLRVIRNNENLGFAAACNIGSRAATGDYLLFLNPDSLLQENSVAKLLSGFEAETNVGMTGGRLINLDGTEQAGGRRAVPTPWRSLVRAFGLSRFADRWPRLFHDFNLHKQPLPEQPIEVEAISGACMLIKREAMEDVGHWDEGYFLHCEDLDLCMRFRQKGWKILFVPDAPILHYLGVCSRKRPFFVEWHKHKGMLRFYRKFFRHQYPGILMWLVVIGVWFRFGGVLVYHTLRRSFRWLGLGHGR